MTALVSFLCTRVTGRSAPRTKGHWAPIHRLSEGFGHLVASLRRAESRGRPLGRAWGMCRTLGLGPCPRPHTCEAAATCEVDSEGYLRAQGPALTTNSTAPGGWSSEPLWEVKQAKMEALPGALLGRSRCVACPSLGNQLQTVSSGGQGPQSPCLVSNGWAELQAPFSSQRSPLEQ